MEVSVTKLEAPRPIRNIWIGTPTALTLELPMESLAPISILLPESVDSLAVFDSISQDTTDCLAELNSPEYFPDHIIDRCPWTSRAFLTVERIIDRQEDIPLWDCLYPILNDQTNNNLREFASRLRWLYSEEVAGLCFQSGGLTHYDLCPPEQRLAMMIEMTITQGCWNRMTHLDDKEVWTALIEIIQEWCMTVIEPASNLDEGLVVIDHVAGILDCHRKIIRLPFYLIRTIARAVHHRECNPNIWELAEHVYFLENLYLRADEVDLTIIPSSLERTILDFFSTEKKLYVRLFLALVFLLKTELRESKIGDCSILIHSLLIERFLGKRGRQSFMAIVTDPLIEATILTSAILHLCSSSVAEEESILSPDINTVYSPIIISDDFDQPNLSELWIDSSTID